MKVVCHTCGATTKRKVAKEWWFVESRYYFWGLTLWSHWTCTKCYLEVLNGIFE